MTAFPPHFCVQGQNWQFGIWEHALLVVIRGKMIKKDGEGTRKGLEGVHNDKEHEQGTRKLAPNYVRCPKGLTASLRLLLLLI
jgi:hypothetical protein